MSKISKVKQLNVINVDIKESYHKENINESVIEKKVKYCCNFCNKQLSTKQNCTRHMDICKSKKYYFEEENRKLKEELEKLKLELHETIQKKDKIIDNLKIDIFKKNEVIDRLKISSNKTNDKTNDITIDVSQNITDNIVYLVQPAFLIGTNRYKIGCSKESRQRLLSYMRGTRILFVFNTKFCCYALEERIKNEFNKKYSRSAGQEWFEGDEQDMKKQIFKICQDYIDDVNYENIIIEN